VIVLGVVCVIVCRVGR